MWIDVRQVSDDRKLNVGEWLGDETMEINSARV